MSYRKNFIYSPGGENENGNDIADSNDDPKEIIPETPEAAPAEEIEEKPVIEKIKEALQDWSNKDEADQEFDDTRV